MFEERYVEVVSFANDTHMVNKYLKAGWVLLNVCSGQNDAGVGYHSMLLGWPAGADVVHPKDDSFPEPLWPNRTL